MNAPFQPAAGMLFGEFRILRPLSAGGMGAVYVAEQTSTGQLRALKLMHRELVADARLRERFEQEARVGALVASEHIVQVIGAGVEPQSGVPWLAMELLEGEDLAARLKRCGLLPPQEVYEVFRQLCHALGAAHRAGVIHRDLKPQNIFLAKANRATAPQVVKVLDFGIAKIAAEASTMATATLGTPLWMAPEQTEARGQISPATDVWALGLIAFVMLTGRNYWRAANDPMGLAMPVLLREILFTPLEPASVRATALGRAGCIVFPFDPWFARCVAREPSSRFATAEEAFAALGPALFGGAPAAMAALREVSPGVAPSLSSAALAAPVSMTGPTEIDGALRTTGASAGSGPPGFLSGVAALSPASGSGVAAGSPGSGVGALLPSTAVPLAASSRPPAGGARTLGRGGVLVTMGVLGCAGVLAAALLLRPGRDGRADVPETPVAAGASSGPSRATPALDVEAKDPAASQRPLPTSGEPGSPRLAPDTPTLARSLPGAASGQPGAASGQPGTSSGQAGTSSGQAGTSSGQAGASSGQAGTSSGQAGTSSGQAGAASGQAGAASGQAGAASGQAGAASGQPGAARPFDHGAAHAALQQKGATARIHCKGRQGPRVVSARVYFNPAGAVQRVLSDPQVAATPSGTCVGMVLSSARVPAFDGDRLVEVPTTVAIE